MLERFTLAELEVRVTRTVGVCEDHRTDREESQAGERSRLMGAQRCAQSSGPWLPFPTC